MSTSTRPQEKPIFCCLCPQSIRLDGTRPVIREGVPAELMLEVALDGPTGSMLPVWRGGLCHTHRQDYELRVVRREKTNG